MIAQCQLCKGPVPFRVPWDEHGEALMVAHIKEKHPEVEL